MSDKNEFKNKLKELEANLKNSKVQRELKNHNLNLNDLEQTIQYYNENFEQFNDEDFNDISTKVNALVNQSNESVFSIYAHKFTNTANYLIDNRPIVKLNVNANFTIKDNTQISEEEFSKRYDKLIENLKVEGEESNLILETPYEKKPLKIYKNNNNSIIIVKESGKNYSTTKNKFGARYEIHNQ